MDDPANILRVMADFIGFPLNIPDYERHLGQAEAGGLHPLASGRVGAKLGLVRVLRLEQMRLEQMRGGKQFALGSVIWFLFFFGGHDHTHDAFVHQFQ